MFSSTHFDVFYYVGIAAVAIYSKKLLIDRNRPRPWIWTYLVLGSIALLAGRLPSLLYNHELSPEENLLLTQTLTLQKGSAIFWKEADGTAGPLNAYLLLGLSSLTGFSGFALGRLAAILCTWASWILLVLMLRKWLNGRLLVYQLAIFPLGVLAVTLSPSLLAFRADLTSLILLQTGMTLGMYGLDRHRLFLPAGAAFSLLPFAQLSSIPVLIASVALLAVLAYRRGQGTALWRGLATGGGLTLGLIFVGICLSQVIDSMLFYYFRRRELPSLSVPWTVARQAVEVPLFIGLLLLWIGYLLPFKGRTDRLDKIVWGWMGVAFLAGISSGVSHFLLLVYPLTWLVAWLSESRQRLAPMPLAFSFLSGVVWLLCGLYVALSQHRLSVYDNTLATQNSRQQQEITALLVRLARPDSRLVVWGQANALHVLSQLPQGTRENQVDFLVSRSRGNVSESRKRYLSDLIRNRPDLFVDYSGVLSQAPDIGQKFPELYHYLQKNYEQVAEIAGVHIYRLRILASESEKTSPHESGIRHKDRDHQRLRPGQRRDLRRHSRQGHPGYAWRVPQKPLDARVPGGTG